MTSVPAKVRPGRLVLALLVALTLVSACGSSAAAPAVAAKTAPTVAATVDGARLTTLAMQDANAYTPKAINGGTDDYHCTLVNAHVSQNSFIVSSQFFPGTGKSVAEVHHAILFLVPPSLAKAAETANNGGKGWTCFGEPPVVGTGLKQFLSMPWLSAWAPGKGKDVLPLTTGTPLPKGSLIIMQVHYNLLAGDLPVRPRVELDTVPASAHLRPTSIQPLVAIPNIPCPTGVAGPLCNRTAELANLSKRFGPYINLFDAGVEAICGEDPANPPTGVTTSCTWSVRKAGIHHQGRSAHAPARRVPDDHAQSRDSTRQNRPGRPQVRLQQPGRRTTTLRGSRSPQGIGSRSAVPTGRSLPRSCRRCEASRRTSSPGVMAPPTKCVLVSWSRCRSIPTPPLIGQIRRAESSLASSRRFSRRVWMAVVVAGSSLVLAGCGNSAVKSTPGATPTPSASSASSVAGPSISARMTCSETEIQNAIVLGLDLNGPPKKASKWVKPVYTCVYQLPDGPLRLLVTEFGSDAGAVAEFKQLKGQYARDKVPLQTLENFDVPAIRASDDVILTVKDNKLLRVAATQLPKIVGPLHRARADLIYLVTSAILRCWSGD